MNLNQIGQLLCDAVRLGGEKAKEVLPNVSGQIQKGRGDFATEADLASEREILSLLTKSAPDIPIVSEETGLQEIPKGASFFAVDPFDGTIIASRGCAEWGVCASFIENGKVLAAVNYQPILNRLITATLGNGCFLNGEKIQLSPEPLPERFVLSVDASYASTNDHLRRFLYLPAISERLLLSRNLACAVANTYEFLTGKVDIYAAIGGGKIWDYSPTSLLISEAGGAVLDVSGNPILWTQMSAVPIFGRSLDALQEFLHLSRDDSHDLAL